MKRARLVRFVRSEVAFLAVLLVLAVALVFMSVSPDHWRRGVAVISAGVVLGGVLRAVLPIRRAGMLVIRGRVWDVSCYGVLGAAILITDILVPS